MRGAVQKGWSSIHNRLFQYIRDVYERRELYVTLLFLPIKVSNHLNLYFPFPFPFTGSIA